MRIGAAHHLIPYSLWRVTLKIYAQYKPYFTGPLSYYELERIGDIYAWHHKIKTPPYINVYLSHNYDLFYRKRYRVLNDYYFPFHPLHLTKYCRLYCYWRLILFVLCIPIFLIFIVYWLLKGWSLWI